MALVQRGDHFSQMDALPCDLELGPAMEAGVPMKRSSSTELGLLKLASWTGCLFIDECGRPNGCMAMAKIDGDALGGGNRHDLWRCCCLLGVKARPAYKCTGSLGYNAIDCGS